MTETKFTVFYEGGFLTDGNCGCHALEDFLTETVVGGMPPIAWAPVCYWDWARENPGRDCDELRAESIAAGRTIEMIDNQWVPRGVPVEAPKLYVFDEYTVEVSEDAVHWLSHDLSETFAFLPAQPTKERTRPALDWADSKRVDRFADFIVERFDADDGMPAAPDHSHPLQRIAQEGDQLHGSAFLRKG
jgi:hypothetical protein